ncbi:MAG: hypothetical protein QOD71_2134 [Thermoleophilaceae bacterium]|jgi:hypothetical protein|nr:hypothetical protein [Thermoleophilaceae bacterium]
MQELIPILGGAAFGAVAAGLPSRYMRPGFVLAFCLVVGATASLVSGEIGESPLFVLWDTTQCVLAFLATRIAVRLLAGRGVGRRGRHEMP